MEWHPKTIVVGVDGSETSVKAAEIATEMARIWQAKLLIVTVVRTPEGWWGIGGAPPSPEALSAALVEGQEQVLNEIEGRLDLGGVDYETVQELGDPSWKLIEVAESRNADLIIIGKRGAGLAERMMLGSVADRLAHHSPVPVLVVP
ncbi:MAG TPA: universal stress protein [Acidimicrobiia bacterium]|jgi:nucleotide-binding universal stress UspA family protein